MDFRSNNEIIEPRVDLEVPITAIRQRTKSKLSILLNAEKVLVNEDGYFRDWRGIFTLSGLTQSEFALIQQSEDKMGKLLDIWNRKNLETNTCVTLSQLQHCFAIIDRFDICDDTMALFVEDALAYNKNEVQPIIQQLPSEPVNSNLLTFQDEENYRNGLPLPIYDALVICSDQERDQEFAKELIDRLTEKNYLLCVKDRDLLPGLPFETDSLLTLLSKRCNRLIVIISKAFLESNMQIFITNYAQALGIEKGQRKIIPCVLENCELPMMLKFCYRLDYYRNNRLFDFWDKLDKSLKLTEERKQPARNQDVVVKFSQAPSTPEKVKKFLFSKENVEEDEPKKQIMPPPRRLRESSSMMSLDKVSNGSAQKMSTSTLDLSIDDQKGDRKHKKWYRMFLPPHKEKVNEIENEPVKEKKEKKRKWFKSKKKIAVEV